MDESFHGTSRYSIRKRLGAGGMGVVYHAYDEERCVDVALKTLRNVDADAIYRIKKEFRALCTVSHPNLVTLHELVRNADDWFFTMELIKGTDFIAHVRQAGAFAAPKSYGRLLDSTQTSPWRARGEVTPPPPLDPPEPVPSESIVNIGRLRRAFVQLVEGISALHEAGRLHRDIKSSNIMVDGGGRVVVLDFGLVAELSGVAINSLTAQGGLLGTPAYMAPEQASEEPLTSAADWYSVGVVLYEALTGRLPFEGSTVDMLLRKLNETPPIPSTIAPGTPVDLNVLCMELLSRDPIHRPTGEQLLERLRPDQRPPSATFTIDHRGTSRHTGFFGRSKLLAELSESFDRCRDGDAVTVYVRGPSGIGKSAVVRHFLDELEENEDVVILSGRCYEQESVPYKAVDTVIDRLTRYLVRLDRMEVEALLPRDVRALTRVFGVLERVAAIADAPTKRAEIDDPMELRRRAFRALKQLLARISDRHCVVVFIDDLQWGDVDSAGLLRELMRPPEPPAMLLIGAFRVEDEPGSAVLAELLGKRVDDRTQALDLSRPKVLTVGPLAEEDAVGLAKTLLNPTGDVEAAAARIAKDAEGSPFMVEALARAEGTSVKRALGSQIDVLGTNARHLLEIVAVAGRPLNRQVALRAAGIPSGQEAAAIGAVRAANMARSASGGTIEVYHDRIRRAVIDDLEPTALADRHRSLALTLEMLEPGDAHALYVHFEGAGDRSSAASYAAIAASEAATAVAFDRAARLYSAALELGVADPDRHFELLVGLAESLANSGRSVEASQVYLRAAEGRPYSERLEMTRKGAEHLLIAGHQEEGVAQLRVVLAAIGQELAPTQDVAFASVVELRKQLDARGMSFVERQAKAIPERTRLEIDILGSVSVGLMIVDTVRGADFQLRHLLAALDAGEPVRVARSLALEACYVALGGGRQSDRVGELTKLAVRLSRRLGDPRAIGSSALAIGLSAWLRGDWQKAKEQLTGTEKLLRDKCTGVAWELAMTRVTLLDTLFYLGEIPELVRRIPRVATDAESRGDTFTMRASRLGHAVMFWLAQDRPDEAEADLDQHHRANPTSDEFFTRDGLWMLGKLAVHLYRGDGESAIELIQGTWARFVHSKMAQTQYMWIEALSLRARAHLARAVAGQRVEGSLAWAESDAARLEHEGVLWALALAAKTRGLVALCRGDVDEAVEELSAATTLFDDASMKLYAAVTRYRLGEAVGGERGTSLRDAAELWLRDQAIDNPAGVVRMIAPASV